MDDPTRRARPRPPQDDRRLTMLRSRHAHRCAPTSAGLLEHVARGRASASPSSPARWCSATRSAPTSTRCSPTALGTPTPSCAAPTRSPPTASRPGPSSTGRWPTSSPGSTASPSCEPQIEGFGQLDGADGEKLGGNGPPTFAGNWIDDPDLNPYQLVEGRAPAANDEVVINRGAAKDGDLAVGDRTIVATPEPVEVRSSASRRSAARTASGRRRSPRSRCEGPQST